MQPGAGGGIPRANSPVNNLLQVLGAWVEKPKCQWHSKAGGPMPKKNSLKAIETAEFIQRNY
jgi:hypothetical protein